MRITVISDTHSKHKEITKDLPGGDLILCAGDISTRGFKEEIKNFCSWYECTDYDKSVFIAGNHDFGFQDIPEECATLVSNYGVEYLQDDLFLLGEDYDSYEERVKIYGSPWQPEFFNWAFNLPRNGELLYQRWANIPEDTDILITHGPPAGVLDTVFGRVEQLGCQLLSNRLQTLKPKIHVFGHIHTGYGYKFDGITHYFNASVLSEKYKYTQKPFTFDWDPITNKLEFLK